MDHDVLNFKDKFDYVLRDDEQVVWTGDVNKGAYMKKALISALPIFIVLAVLAIVLAVVANVMPTTSVNIKDTLYTLITILVVLLILSIPIIIILVKRSADNTFVCITDKQVMIREGIIKNDITRIALSTVSTVKLVTSIFDGEVKSSDFYIELKWTSGNVRSKKISSLNYVDEAYKILTKLSDNETVKVQNN